MTAPLARGIAVTVRFLDDQRPHALADVIVYDPADANPATGLGRHRVHRFVHGRLRLVPLPEEPGTGPADQAAILLGHRLGDTLSLSERHYLRTGTNTEHHFAPLITRHAGARAFIAYSDLGCPSGLRSWTTAGGAVQSSLALESRPGELLATVAAGDRQNHVWVLNGEDACVATDRLRTAVQFGSELVFVEEP